VARRRPEVQRLVLAGPGGKILASTDDGAVGQELSDERLSAALAPIDFLARRRYFLDGLFGAMYRIALLGLSRVVGWVDRYVVDGVLNALSALTLRAGDAARRLQTGQPQDYVYGVALGVLLLLVWAQLR